uniref:HD-Zip IV C-terminal domain-containing protein n=1 Tax=Solanum lycopersicum TaxID=4081 RepID=A0A3Q7IUD3_SOLLC
MNLDILYLNEDLSTTNHLPSQDLTTLCRLFHDPEGLKNTIQLSQRMVKSFFEILSMTDNHGDFLISSQLNRGDRISIRNNEEIIQPKGFISIATTSLLLPLSFQDVFNFFKDDKTRNQGMVVIKRNDCIYL